MVAPSTSSIVDVRLPVRGLEDKSLERFRVEVLLADGVLLLWRFRECVCLEVT